MTHVGVDVGIERHHFKPVSVDPGKAVDQMSAESQRRTQFVDLEFCRT